MSASAKLAAVFALGLVLGAAAGSWGQRALLRRMARRGAPDPARMVDRLGRRLGLDAAQKTRILDAFERHRPEVEALRRETFERFEAIRSRTDADIRKTLTPKQRETFDLIVARHRARREHWAPPPPPPAAP